MILQMSANVLKYKGLNQSFKNHTIVYVMFCKGTLILKVPDWYQTNHEENNEFEFEF